MDLAKLASLPFRYRPWKPRHLGLIMAELKGTAQQPERSDEEHLRAALDWMARAQDVRNEAHDAGGVSAGWSFADGWLPSYPETSGYIVETWLEAARRLGRDDLRARAGRVLDWELGLQNDDGSFPGHFNEPGAAPVVFNTGQILHGLVSGAHALEREDCAEAATRAARWLAEILDEDGGWRRFTFRGVPHAYNSRVAWAMLRLHRLRPDEMVRDAARANLRWVLERQDADGWIRENAFSPGLSPFTHNIAYVIRGLLEGGALLGDDEVVAGAEKAARAVIPHLDDKGWLAGTFDAGWQPRATYCCVTGTAQMSIIWSRLVTLRGAEDLRPAIERANRYLKRTQRITGNGGPEDGGIAGSAPLWGGYERLMYPNWAAKFFADALLLATDPTPVPADEKLA